MKNVFMRINPLAPDVSFLYPLKNVVRGYKKGTLGRSGSRIVDTFSQDLTKIVIIA